MNDDDEPCIHLLDRATCTLCNGRANHERTQAATVTARWPARYRSRLACSHTPDVGDIICRLANGNIVCSDCAPRTR